MSIKLSDLKFNNGFKTKIEIEFLGEKKSIILKLKAFYESDGITKEQKKALELLEKDGRIINKGSNIIKEHYPNELNRFVPKTLLINRDGACALLCDDIANPDEGIAICLKPTLKIMSQDEYL